MSDSERPDPSPEPGDLGRRLATSMAGKGYECFLVVGVSLQTGDFAAAVPYGMRGLMKDPEKRKVLVAMVKAYCDRMADGPLDDMHIVS